MVLENTILCCILYEVLFVSFVASSPPNGNNAALNLAEPDDSEP